MNFPDFRAQTLMRCSQFLQKYCQKGKDCSKSSLYIQNTNVYIQNTNIYSEYKSHTHIFNIYIQITPWENGLMQFSGGCVWWRLFSPEKPPRQLIKLSTHYYCYSMSFFWAQHKLFKTSPPNLDDSLLAGMTCCTHSLFPIPLNPVNNI